MSSYLLIILLLVGLLLYILPDNAKTNEIGRMMFFASLVGLCVALGPATVHWLHG